jgi:hypothetical protein
VRRLTTAEYDASIQSMFGITSTFASGFTPDARQDSFSRNDAQRVDPVLVMQLDDAAAKVAAQLRPTFSSLAPCQNPGVASDAEACARTFVEKFAAIAYRRPATSRELEALLTVYRAGAQGAAYEDGLEAAAHALLMAPAFLYVTELGDAPRAAVATLTPYETASALSFLLTGTPPDAALSGAAKDGKLTTPDERRGQATRLLATPAARTQVTRIVEEWLGIDRIVETAKDSNVYGDFARLRDSMKREADAFVSQVMWESGGTVADLIGADWTPAEDDLARMYLNLNGGDVVPRTNGRVSLAGTHRRGIFGQGAFLSVYAHATETAPVLRGVALLRRIVCDDIPPPASLNINVVPPLPDPSKTTRERFTTHVSDTLCASCHNKIDPFGFSFENLNGMGKEVTTDNGHPVETDTVVGEGLDFDGPYKDSTELVTALARSKAVKGCFARHLFRYSAARSDSAVKGAEDAFVKVWDGLPEASQGKLQDVIVAFVGSDGFMQRRADP